MAHHILSWLSSGLLVVLLAVSPIRADEKHSWDQPPFQAFEKKLDDTLRKYYPDVKRERTEASPASLRWSYKTRKFMVHLSALTGEWQEATEMMGPDRKGIICTAVIREGAYAGMAAVPQTFDRQYFQVLMMAPNRKDVNAHLVVRLYYPADTDKAVISEIAELVQKFDSNR